MAEIGELALTAFGTQNAPRHALRQRDRRRERGKTIRAQYPRPVVKPTMNLLPLALLRASDALRTPAKERRERDRARPRRGSRSLERLQQSEPVSCSGRAEDASGAVDDCGDAHRVERLAHELGVAVRAHEHRDVTRL